MKDHDFATILFDKGWKGDTVHLDGPQSSCGIIFTLPNGRVLEVVEVDNYTCEYFPRLDCFGSQPDDKERVVNDCDHCTQDFRCQQFGRKE